MPVRRSRVLLAAVVGSLLAALIGAATASAVERPFSLRYGENARGNIAFAANTLIDCPFTVGSCRTGSIAAHDNLAANNNSRGVQRVDVDSDPSTETSSRAMLSIPAGAEVRFAGLYWAGNPTNGYSESDPADVDDWSHPLIETPAGSGYQTVTADQFDSFVYPDANNRTWSGFADVTDIVRAGGSGEYTVAGVPLRLGSFSSSVSSYGGWALWVVYAHPSEPWRNLSVFDGLQGPTQTFTVSGFTAPPSGSFNTAVGVSAIEGDAATTGDQMRINGVNLFDSLTPAQTFFNSRITRFGVDDGDRTPNHPNQMGFDTKLVDADAVNASIIPNGATEAQVAITTTGDGYWANAIAMAIEIFNPDITVTKSVENVDRPGADDAHPGEELEYTVTLENATGTATDAAADVVLRDGIPAGTTYVPDSLEMVAGDPLPTGGRTDAAGDDSAEHDGVNDRVVFGVGDGAGAASGGTLGAGELATVRFRVTVDASVAAGDTITNQADADFAGDTTGEELSATSNEVQTPITDPVVDLELSKTATPLVDPGDQVTWTLTVVNNGPDVSPGATVTDTLPAGVTNIQTPTPGCSVGGSTVTCDVGLLDTGDAAQIVITGDAPSTPSTCFENAASVDGDAGDPVAGNDGDAARTCTTPAADLELTKTATPVVDPGGQVTWALTVTNVGPDTSTAATVTDTLPAGVTNIQTSTAGCSVLGSAVTCDVGALDPGESAGIVITGTAPSSSSTCFENDASVDGELRDPVLANDEDSARTCTTPVADLELTKTATPVVDPGAPITWTLTVTNTGPDHSTGATVTDTIPAGVTNVQAPTAGCSVQGNTVTCDVGPLDPGDDAQITITGNAPLAPSTCVENDATVTGDEDDPVLADNDDAARTCTTPAADLELSKTATPVVDPGDEVTWTLTVTNNGPDQSSSATVTDTLPADVSNVQTSTPGCSVQGNAVSCAVGPLDPGASAEIVVTGDAPQTPSACFENQASVVGSARDPAPGDNDDAARTCTSPAADLELAKTAAAVVDPGDPVTWTLTVTNNGPDRSPGATVTDTVPAGVTDVQSPTAGCSVQGSTVTCDVGALEPGDDAQITITGNAPLAPSTCVENAATVAGDARDPVLADNEDSARTCTTPAADLELTKTAASVVDPGDPVTWTLTVTNNGPDRSSSATVADSLPAGVTNVQAQTQGCTVQGNAVTCDVGPLDSGDSAQIVLTGDAPQTPSTCFENQASVVGSTRDPAPGDNDDAARTCISPAADLELSKTASASVDPGGRVTWTLTVRNAGPDRSSGSTVTDRLPAVVSNVQTQTAGCDVQGNTVVCDVGPLDSGDSKEIVITGDAPTTSSTCFDNDASVVGAERDPVLANSEDTAETCTTREADLGLTKSATPVVEPSTPVTWTLTVTNHGPRDSTGATVVDAIPAGIANATSPTAGCEVVRGEVRCEVGPLAAGAATEITVTGTAPTSPSACFENSATVTADGVDPDSSNDSATVSSCTRPPRHDLSLTKTASRTRVTVGDRFSYTLTTRNAGPDAAPDMMARDTVPSQFDVVAASSDQGTCTVTGNEVACAVGTLANQATATVTVTVVAVRAGETTNTAVVDPPRPPGDRGQPGGDPDPDNNADGVQVRVVKPQLKLSKHANRKRIRAGQTATYGIKMRNPSRGAVRNVRVCDHLPAGLVFVRATPRVRVSAGSYCWRIERLPAKRSKTLRLTARALRGTSGTITNRATAESPNARTARARRALRVKGGQVAAGGVTG